MFVCFVLSELHHCHFKFGLFFFVVFLEPCICMNVLSGDLVVDHTVSSSGAAAGVSVGLRFVYRV